MEISAKPQAVDIANFFILHVRKDGGNLMHLKLQKLLYFAQAWHLVFYEESLFEDKIEAWIDGPTIAHIHKMFKKYRWCAIIEEVKQPNLSEKTVKHLKNVFDYYGKFTDYQLEKIIHNAEPWKKARGNTLDAPSSNSISEDSMKHFYSKIHASIV